MRTYDDWKLMAPPTDEDEELDPDNPRPPPVGWLEEWVAYLITEPNDDCPF